MGIKHQTQKQLQMSDWWQSINANMFS